MKKLLISVLITVSTFAMVGCNEKQVDGVIDNIPTVEEDVTTQRLDDEVNTYILEDFEVFRRVEYAMNSEELGESIMLLREHFKDRLNGDDMTNMTDLYKNVDGLTSDQKEFFKEYYKFCEEMSKLKVELPTDMDDKEGLARVKKTVDSQRKKIMYIYQYYMKN